MLGRSLRTVVLGALIAAAAVVIAPDASAAGASGDWIITVVRITGTAPAHWGYSGTFTAPSGPQVWGQVESDTLDGYRWPTWQFAFVDGESQQQISTTRDLGGKQITLVQGTHGGTSGAAGGGNANGFHPGDEFRLATYVPGGTFSDFSATPAVNADVQVYVGRGAGLVLGSGDSVQGLGADALGVAAGDVSVHQTMPSGAFGLSMSCTACVAGWTAPNGVTGGQVHVPTTSFQYGEGPYFTADTSGPSDYTFSRTGGDVFVLGGRPVLGSFVDLGSYRALFL